MKKQKYTFRLKGKDYSPGMVTVERWAEPANKSTTTRGGLESKPDPDYY